MTRRRRDERHRLGEARSVPTSSRGASSNARCRAWRTSSRLYRPTSCPTRVPRPCRQRASTPVGGASVPGVHSNRGVPPPEPHGAVRDAGRPPERDSPRRARKGGGSGSPDEGRVLERVAGSATTASAPHAPGCKATMPAGAGTASPRDRSSQPPSPAPPQRASRWGQVPASTAPRQAGAPDASGDERVRSTDTLYLWVS